MLIRPIHRSTMRWLLTLLTLAIVFPCANGCSRHAFRKAADREAYRLLESRQFDHRWDIPERVVEADPRSRLADVHDPDCGPVPPDDPAAECYMRRPFNSKRRIDYWDEIGRADAVDSQHWLQHLPYDESGVVVLDKDLTVELALMHSRDFQIQVEVLYLQTLALSSNRFEFMLNWFGGSDLDFNATQDGFDAQRDVANSNQLGFSRELLAGGQFLANLMNTFTWSFDGSGRSNFSAGSLAFSLTQPLLRGAFRHVRTESLTQAERSLLYAVRDFARFRRQFYLDTVSQYLSLLIQTEAVKIEEENIALLERSVEEHEVRLQNELVAPIQADQVFQDLQNARLDLINSKQSLETALDQFKFQLGLPARIEIRIDRSFLNPFQLNSADVEQLDEDVREFKISLNQHLPPDDAPKEFLDESVEKLKSLSDRVEQLKPQVDSDLKKWLDALEQNQPTESDSPDTKLTHSQQVLLSKRIKKFMDGLNEEIKVANKLYDQEFGGGADGNSDGDSDSDSDSNSGQTSKRRSHEYDKPSEDTDEDKAGEDSEQYTESEEDNDKDTPAVKKWKTIQGMLALPGGLSDRVSTLLIYQTQIRLYLIEIQPLKLDEKRAVKIALENRLDLMNSRGAVVDAYRQVEIAADQLESDLSVTASANLLTDPNRDNAFRFDGDENVYTLEANFDGPLNRLNERNAYRASQIAYQQQRRAYMADEDAIVNSVRLNLRQLQTNRFNFQISQQQLITATRQVRLAQLNLRRGEGDSSSTQDLLQAFQTLRDTKNLLVSSWIAYEISRIATFVDIESLTLDEAGRWTNEKEEFADNSIRSEQDELTQQSRPEEAIAQLEFEPPQSEPLEFEPSQSESIEPEPIQQPPTPSETPLLDAPDPDARRDNGGLFRSLLGRR